MDMAQKLREDARLIILKALKGQPDECLHSGLLESELGEFGINKDRDWVHSELDWLANMGAITLRKPGTVWVAQLTEKGARHLHRAISIEGIARPSRSQG